MSLPILERGEKNAETESYLKGCLSHIWDNLPFLLLGNVLFFIFCIPSFVFLLVGDVLLSLWVSCFSAVPAFSGLLCLVAEALRNRKPTIRSFTLGVCRLYGRSAILGGLGILSLLWLLSALSYGGRELSFMTVCLLASSLVGFLFMIALLVHAFPIMVFWNPSLRETFAWALSLASRYRIPTAGIISLGLLCVFLAWWTKLGLLIILPAIWAVFSCELTVRLLQNRWPEGNGS